MIRTKRRLRLCTALLACCLVFIWGNSLLPGEVSGAISNEVKEILEALFPGGETSSSESSFLLRKAAHFTEFAALGMCLGWLFGMLEKGKIPPFLLGAAAACVDETIQRFVPGRGPSLRDVGIDCSGVLAGLILLHLGHHYWRRIRAKQPLEET